MKSGVFIVKDGLKSLHKKLDMMTKTQVLVGIPQKTTQRKEDPINNATIGYIHENGAPEAGIPPRPFLIPGVKDTEKKVGDIFKAGSIALLTGDRQTFREAQDAAGLAAVAGIQNKITDGPFEPLKASTIAARERRGRTGTNPLIDTGQLRRSITYVKREK